MPKKISRAATPPLDQDGKSQTASAVDQQAYPEQYQVAEESFGPPPSHAEIRARAYELWKSKGFPEGSADQDWAEAERELLNHPRSRADLREHRERSGSVQR